MKDFSYSNGQPTIESGLSKVLRESRPSLSFTRSHRIVDSLIIKYTSHWTIGWNRIRFEQVF